MMMSLTTLFTQLVLGYCLDETFLFHSDIPLASSVSSAPSGGIHSLPLGVCNTSSLPLGVSIAPSLVETNTSLSNDAKTIIPDETSTRNRNIPTKKPEKLVTSTNKIGHCNISDILLNPTDHDQTKYGAKDTSQNLRYRDGRFMSWDNIKEYKEPPGQPMSAFRHSLPNCTGVQGK